MEGQQNSNKINEEYVMGQVIAKSGWSEVRLVFHRFSRSQRMCKIIKKTRLDTATKQVILNEIGNLKDLNHPGILKFYEFFEDPKRYYIITEACKGGDLFSYIKKNGPLSE